MQVAMLVAAKVAEAVPAGHSVHWELPAKLYDPAGHCRHVVMLVAPVTFEYLPAEQAVHVALWTVLYVPTGQIWQVDALAARVADEAVPAGHNVQDVFPSKLYVPVPHVAQVALPAAELMVPAGQITHVEASTAPVAGDAVPAGHSVHEVLPAKLYLPVPQVVQVALPAEELMVPAGQITHVDASTALVAADAVPAGHCVHDVLPSKL